MEIDIFDSLFKENVSDVVNEIIKFATKTTTTNNDYYCAVVQCLIDLTNMDFTVSNEHLEMFTNDNAIDKIVHEIYSSDFQSDEELLKETQTKFFELFISKTAAKKLLHVDLLKIITNFLESSITHQQIGKDTTYNMSCHMILSDLLHPILKLLNSVKVDIAADVSTELNRIVDLIISHIPHAIDFKSISTDIARKVVATVEDLPNAFFSRDDDECKILNFYYRMLTVEDNFMQMTAIKSLKKLASAETRAEADDSDDFACIQSRLVEFFLDEGTGRKKKMSDVIKELMTRKALKTELSSLLQIINQADEQHRILTDEMKFEIYSNVINGTSKKLVSQAVEWMLEKETDFWVTLINVMSQFEDEIDYSFLSNIANIAGTELTDDKILELFTQTAENAEKQRHVAIVFAHHLKSHPTSVIILDEIFPLCVNEEIFSIILDGFINGDSDQFRETFINNLEKVSRIVDELLKTFEQSESFLIANAIVFALKKLQSFSAEYVNRECRVTFIKTLQRLETSYKKREVDKKSLKRLTMLLENHTMNLMSRMEIVKMNIILQELCTRSSLKNFESTKKYAIRCFTNFVKSLWMKNIQSQPIGINYTELADTIKGFMASLKTELEKIDESSDLGQAVLILTSCLDLLVFFQPSMERDHPNIIFSKVTFPLTKEQVKSIATLIERLTFSNGSARNRTEFQLKKYLVQKWVYLCRSYQDFPSATASEKFLRHYSKDSEFKQELEEILSHVMEKPEALEKTAAFAILNLANQSETKLFKQFFSAFNEFLGRVDAQNKSVKLFFIATHIIKKFPLHIRENKTDQRLLILDFIKTIINDIPQENKKKLKIFLPNNLTVLKLSPKDLKQYQTFVEDLDKIDIVEN